MTDLQTIKARFGIIGRSELLDRALGTAVRVANTDLTVLIQGESGVGKEVFSKIIHALSARKHENFIAVNCGAIPAGTINSELFGHEKGSFTGATSDRKGYFETVSGGTIFLDEIGEMPLDTQAFLLRVLESGEFIRVGSSAVLKTDVRVIAATNVDLAQAKAQGRFREDLFYRLNVITIELPPLRDRPEDIPLLAQHFLARFREKTGKNVTSISARATEALTCARWVGNVRELENAIERAVVLSTGPVIDVADLPAEVRNQQQRGGSEVEVLSLAHLPYAQAKKLAMRAFERRYLSALLEKSGNNVSEAARAAGVDRSNFRRLLKQYEVGGRSMKQGDEDEADRLGT